MHIRQTSPLRLFALCCLLLLNVTACSFLSGDNAAPTATPSPEATSQMTVAQAKENLRIAESDLEKARQQSKDIEKAKADARTAREAADAAKKKADEYRDATIKDNKNPDDPKEAPNTYKAVQDWKDAEAKAVDAEQDLLELPGAVARATMRVEKAKQALKEVQQREQGAATPEPSAVGTVTAGNVAGLPLWLAGFLLALTLLVVAEGVTGFYLFRITLDKLKSIEKNLDYTKMRLKRLSEKQADLSVGTPALDNGRELESDHLRQHLEETDQRTKEALHIGKHLQHRVAQLEARLAELEHSIENMMHSSAVSVSVETPAPELVSQQVAAARAGSSVFQQEVVTRELKLTFPITVTDCLSSLHEAHAKTLTLKAAHLSAGLLVKAERGEFLLVEDDRPAHPLLVIPGMERFVTKQDFYNNYDDFYNCMKVTSGEVWIVSPAIVEEVAEGWRLRLKGELKV